jgi:RNA polymerase sigma factor (sigma-70 family)
MTQTLSRSTARPLNATTLGGRAFARFRSTRAPDSIAGVSGNLTTIEVQRCLDELAADGGARAEEIVRTILSRSVERLHRLCASLLYRRYPRLTWGPLNLKPDEMLSAVVERLIKAMREARPRTVREFFSLANQHLRWELNDVARRLDAGGWAIELDSRQPAATFSTHGTTREDQSALLRRILQAIESLPEDERETFNLVRIQGMAQVEAAEVLGVSTKTVQRRLNQCVVRLSGELRDLMPSPASRATE